MPRGAADLVSAVCRLGGSLAGVPVEGRALSDDCVRELSSLLGAERFCAFGSLPAPTSCALDLAVFRGFPPGVDVAQRMDEALEGCSALGPPAFDASAPAAPAARPNQVVRPLAELSPESRERARQLMGRLGTGGLDVARVVVCDGPVFLAWVGALRRDEFTGDECLAFERVVPLLRDHLVLARRLRQAELSEAGFDAVLDALGEPAFLVRRDGRLVASNRSADDLGLAASELREQLRRALAGEAAEWTARPLGSGAAPEGYLVMRHSDGQPSRPVLAAARHWKLTRAETRVLAQLGQGRSNKDIAQTLGCSVRTVEIHASSILRKAGCRGRSAVVAELARTGGSV